MENRRIIIKYYSKKMLLIVDINLLIKTVLKTFGDNTSILFVAMNKFEKKKSSRIDNHGIKLVKECIWIIEECADGTHIRKTKLEELNMPHG